MKRLLWLGLVAGALLVVSQRGGAEDNTRSAAKPAVVAKEVVRINGGQGCRRSWQLLGEYTSVNEACWAAHKFREEKKLDLEITVAAKDGKFSGAKVEFRVYRNPCKGYALEATTDNFDKALALAEKIRKRGDAAEVVTHFIAN